MPMPMIDIGSDRSLGLILEKLSMKTLSVLAAALALSTLAATATAGDLTESQVHAVIDPWYSQFTATTRVDVKAIQENVVSPDYQTCSGFLPGECWGRDVSIRTVSGLTTAIPDMKFQVKEILISGDRVTVL